MISVDSPDSCDDACEQPSISVGGTMCASDISANYEVTYTAIAGAIVTSDVGDDSVAGTITGIPSGMDVTITSSYPGCLDEVMVVYSVSCPADPCSNSYTTGVEICDAIIAGVIGLGLEDCDNGGVDNQTECDNGGDPSDPSDDCDFVMDGTIDICALLSADADNTLATEDCDGDGEDNATECDNGTDPTDPCSNSYVDGAAICAAIDAGATGFADVDCDGGGVNDEQECTEGTDPMNPCDDAGVTGATICAYITLEGENSIFFGIDCDGDGENNEE